MNKQFFELLRVAIGKQETMEHLPAEQEWQDLYAMARKQGVVELMFEGVEKVRRAQEVDNVQEVRKVQGGHEAQGVDNVREVRRVQKVLKEQERQINPLLLSKWYGLKEKGKAKYHKHREFIGRLAHFYEQKGIGMMLLKGYGLSLNYPVPERRKPGDVDIFLYDLEYPFPASPRGGEKTDGQPLLDRSAFVKGCYDMPAWKKGDEAIAKTFRVEVRTGCEHHTQYNLDGISVENHYDFVNTRIRKSSQSLEKVFKELAQDTSNKVMIETTSGCQEVCLPSDKLNSIFLLRHTTGHFAAEGVSVRNVLDWGFFVQHARHLDWDWLWNVAREYNMHHFLGCLNAICIEECGFDSTFFVLKEYNKALKERVLNEIMDGVKLPENASVWKRTSLWWKHRWKHRICYSDSMLSSFVYSIRANVGGSSAESL